MLRYATLLLFLALAQMGFGQAGGEVGAPRVGTLAKRPFTFEDMMKLKRVEEPVPTPDGKWVLFAAVDVDLAANTKTTHLWIVPISFRLCVERKSIVHFQDHAHVGAKQIDFGIFDAGRLEAGSDLGPNLLVISLVHSDQLRIAL